MLTIDRTCNAACSLLTNDVPERVDLSECVFDTNERIHEQASMEASLSLMQRSVFVNNRVDVKAR